MLQDGTWFSCSTHGWFSVGAVTGTGYKVPSYHRGADTCPSSDAAPLVRAYECELRVHVPRGNRAIYFRTSLEQVAYNS